MSNKAPKSPKLRTQKQKVTQIHPNIHPSRWLWGGLLGLCTIMGGAAVVLPRVTAVFSDPPDENDPFSSSITITNIGYIPLDSVTANLSVGAIQFLSPEGQPRTLLGDEARGSISVSEWLPHNLGIDDRFTVSLNDPFKSNRKSLVGAQIAIVVDYELPLIHWHREKRFPVFAKRASNGNFYWYADTLPTKPN